jgi:DNA-binding MarR family transcriptional regulator
MVTGGNVTGLADTLEREGLVVREPDETDRRALRVKLTREGRKVFRTVAVEHEGWVIDMFEGLSDEEAAALGEQLITLKNHVLENVPVEAVREHKS